MFYNIDICYFVYMIRFNCVCIQLTLSTTVHDVFFHEHCYYMDVSLLAHLFVQTSPCSIPCIRYLSAPCLFHDVTVLSAQVLVGDLRCFQSFIVV